MTQNRVAAKHESTGGMTERDLAFARATFGEVSMHSQRGDRPQNIYIHKDLLQVKARLLSKKIAISILLENTKKEKKIFF